ncbi:hypothetical protein [Methylocystis heyeri]|uniref:Transposase n=1 Tax=Methylocystis heyeri TaxID=391905 RepID=A0A6B8KCA3_9HYPH|nr:hypothetical protein [Methylocystis heyeri]QGM45846.1 hypothetical protein H2LOC_009105 [Methylocystis heyeri]
MVDRDPEPLDGKDKTVEVDETYIGKPKLSSPMARAGLGSAALRPGKRP